MAPPAVLMVGTGEYTTGFVAGAASTSDKKVGVVGLSRELLPPFVIVIFHFKMGVLSLPWNDPCSERSKRRESCATHEKLRGAMRKEEEKECPLAKS